jgi:predicted RNA-binding Zn-ribbon protein involved in translation (DUF1610 family)
MHFIIDYVQNSMPPGWKSNSTGWTSGNCPMCIHNGQIRADKRRRGGFHFDDEGATYNCFNCGFKASYRVGQTRLSGKFKSLLIRGLGFEKADVQRLTMRLMQDRTADQIFIEAKKPEIHRNNWPSVALPDGAVPIQEVDIDALRNPDSFIQSVEHIADRGLLYHNDWYYTASLKHRSRIILPFRHQGNVVGYISRWTKPERNNETPKYMLSQPQNFVFNLDAQKNNQTVIVTEGPYDAIVTGGVALNGTALSEQQVRTIDALRKRVVVLPDFDNAGSALVNAALENGWNVAYPDWAEDCKDANEAMLKYGRLFTVKNTLDNIVTSTTKARLLSRKYCK